MARDKAGTGMIRRQRKRSCRGPGAGEERKGRVMGNGEPLPPMGATNPCALLAGSLGPSS